MRSVTLLIRTELSLCLCVSVARGGELSAEAGSWTLPRVSRAQGSRCVARPFRWHERSSSDRQERKTREDAQEPGNPECQLVVAKRRPDRAGTEGRHRRAELVARANPPVDHTRVLAAEGLVGETYRRWNRGNPVEAVEHR